MLLGQIETLQQRVEIDDVHVFGHLLFPADAGGGHDILLHAEAGQLAHDHARTDDHRQEKHRRASVRPLNFWLRTRASVMDRATTMGNEVNRLDSDSMI